MVKERPQMNNSESNRELIKAQEQLDNFNASVNAMTLDRMNATPKQEEEPQTKLSQNQIANAKDIYLKPKRTIPSYEKFNEDFRAKYEFDKEYVYFIAENKEIKGEDIDLWTKPYPGMPAENWIVPVNKPIWAPRYLAEQIKRKYYHRLVMKDHVATDSNFLGTFHGAIAVDTTVARLDAMPATKSRSIFTGALTF